MLFLKYSNNFNEKEILLFYCLLGLNCNFIVNSFDILSYIVFLIITSNYLFILI